MPHYVAWSKAAGPCGHEHPSVGEAASCGREFNRRVHPELTSMKDLKSWQRGVRKAVLTAGKTQLVKLDSAEQLEEMRDAVEAAASLIDPAKITKPKPKRK